MFIYLNTKRGQSTLEYGVIIAVVVAALLAMQFYVKRGLQGRMKKASDDIGGQFSPENTTGNETIVTSTTSSETVTLDESGRPITDSEVTQGQTRTSGENVGALSQENW